MKPIVKNSILGLALTLAAFLNAKVDVHQEESTGAIEISAEERVFDRMAEKNYKISIAPRANISNIGKLGIALGFVYVSDKGYADLDSVFIKEFGKVHGLDIVKDKTDDKEPTYVEVFVVETPLEFLKEYAGKLHFTLNGDVGKAFEVSYPEEDMLAFIEKIEEELAKADSRP